MAQPSKAPVPSQKLLNLLKDFQQIASMSGYLNHAFDAPQLRLFFTLQGRVMVESVEQGLAFTPKLQAWSEMIGKQLREDSSSTIMTPQIQISAPQTVLDGRFFVVSTITFATKVTDASYLRIRTAVLAAYQAAVAMRDKGVGLEGGLPIPAAEPTAMGHPTVGHSHHAEAPAAPPPAAVPVATPPATDPEFDAFIFGGEAEALPQDPGLGPEQPK